MSIYDRITDEPKMRAVHPGEIIREVLEEEMQLSIAGAARQLHVGRAHLHKVLAGKVGVTPEMALKIGRLFGNGPYLWLALQARYDLMQARTRMASELEKVPEYLNAGMKP